MVNQDDATLNGYLYTTTLPDVTYVGNSPKTTLLQLQSRAPSQLCNLKCGPRGITSGKDVALKFTIRPAPIGAHFMIELNLSPMPPQEELNKLPKDQQKALRELNEKNRMYATFSAYEDRADDKFPNRQRYDYTSKDNNTPPPGPVSFSGQLIDVRYVPGDHKNVEKTLLFPDVQASKQVCFSWQAKRCAKFYFSMDISDLSESKQRTAKTFVDMIAGMLSKGERMEVLARGRADLAQSHIWWPWFNAMPAPVPESFFPWLKQLNPKKPMEIMDFRGNGDFELWPGYIDKVMAVRDRGWAQKEFSTATITQPPKIGELRSFEPSLSYSDHREYLAHVLGCYSYEEKDSKQKLNKYYNGPHQCEIFSDGDANDKKYVVLLNIRPPKTTLSMEGGQDQDLPEEDDNVLINISEMNGHQQTWTGRVVRIPAQFLKYGRNVAVKAKPKVTTPAAGYVVNQVMTTRATFHFGHQGSPTTPTQERLIGLMTDTLEHGGKPVSGANWLKNMLLAQNPRGVDNRATHSPSGFETVVSDISKKRGLNEEQRAVVDYYFTHKLTIVIGPPGTGKSSLIDAITEMEEKLNQRFWACTDSNAACDVLVRKMCKRKQETNPPNFLRIKPAFEEDLTIADTKSPSGHVVIDVGLQRPATGMNFSAAEAIERLLNKKENVVRSMTLQETIRRRVNELPNLKARSTTELFANEGESLEKLIQAFQAFHELKFEGDDPAAYDEKIQKLEPKYYQALRKLQASYTETAGGVFSTSAASSGPFLRRFRPNAMILDEATQFIEAKAVSAIVHALCGGKLERILLVGDDNQLPPTLIAPRNPFAATGVVSLIERLIKTGMPWKKMRRQYRMHPQISSIINKEIYLEKVGGLIDDPSTSSADGVDKFRKFAKQLAAQCGDPNFPEANAVVISPTESPKLSWKTQSPVGSTSRYNLATAHLVFQTAYRLIVNGGFVADNILVIAFYADQVQLLKALFEGERNFDGITVSTVDASRGSENKVVIVDLVVLGAVNGDGMGFLNVDIRRWNVAMSRPQVGRIVIGHKDMITSHGNVKNNAGPWNAFLKEAKDSKVIINGAKLNDVMPVAALQAKLVEVIDTWKSKTGGKSKVPMHKNVLENKSESADPSQDAAFATRSFINATGAGETAALKYLIKAGRILHVAIHLYFTDYPYEGEAEEV
ncbi:hypothetical protein LTR08_007212 [Meristemomyces frigidus]|nr:hypothetical protein LTR08_007212 [Meristemomyces frigidus]